MPLTDETILRTARNTANLAELNAAIGLRPCNRLERNRGMRVGRR
ncbi:hypothetical protein [Bosea sp. (in: a-proteobacteria)]|nr:hypothetical protein [Bosea sp. (in: a-proteobacteria)]